MKTGLTISAAAHAAGQSNGNIIHIVITSATVNSRILKPYLDLSIRKGPRKCMNHVVGVPVRAAVEAAARREGASLNAWLVRAAAMASQGDSQSDSAGSARTSDRHVTGWVR